MVTPDVLLKKIRSVLIGVAVGDAVGVPVEFNARGTLQMNPVTDMFGFGTHNQPRGTFSDDSSLTFCLAEALTVDFDLKNVAQNFIKWRDKGYWTANGTVFDIGGTTNQAISRLKQDIAPEKAGGFSERDNGNGSLMRIAPLMFYLLDKPLHERYDIISKVSSITHGHIRSVVACFYYLELAIALYEGADKFAAYHKLQELSGFLEQIYTEDETPALFNRILQGNIDKLPQREIQSGGYVIHTLEASIWCLLTTDNYRDAVLKAVNLGSDTDTTAAVLGGLAGLLYGEDNIPDHWITQLARHQDIAELAKRMADKLSRSE
jgi:ADP-ribosylglycohydrolase